MWFLFAFEMKIKKYRFIIDKYVRDRRIKALCKTHGNLQTLKLFFYYLNSALRTSSTCFISFVIVAEMNYCYLISCGCLRTKKYGEKSANWENCAPHLREGRWLCANRAATSSHHALCWMELPHFAFAKSRCCLRSPIINWLLATGVDSRIHILCCCNKKCTQHRTHDIFVRKFSLKKFEHKRGNRTKTESAREQASR